MNEILRELNEQIEKTRRRLYKAKTKTGLIMVSRRMDALINLYMRLSSSPPGQEDKAAVLPKAAPGLREAVRRYARLPGTAPYRPLIRTGARTRTARTWRRGEGLREREA